MFFIIIIIIIIIIKESMPLKSHTQGGCMCVS